VYAVTKHLRIADVTSLMTVEVPELLGSASLDGYGISAAADNIVLMRYLEMEGRLDRAVVILKARGVNLRSELRHLFVGREGLRVGSGFTGLRGVLTGLPDAHRPASGSPQPESGS
jgi:circadian clock protein KaiC